jgi:hypothetical protein
MVLLDFKALQEVCVDWGIQDSELFASMQLFKPFKPQEGAAHLTKSTRKASPHEGAAAMLPPGSARFAGLFRDVLAWIAG